MGACGQAKGGSSEGKKKSPAASRRAFRLGGNESRQVSDLAHVGSLRTLLALGHVAGNPITFSQRFEPVTLDGREVDENIGAAVLLDETETLGVVEPFNRTLCHFFCSFVFPVEPAWNVCSGRRPSKKPHSLGGLCGSPDEVTQTLPELFTASSISKLRMQAFLIVGLSSACFGEVSRAAAVFLPPSVVQPGSSSADGPLKLAISWLALEFFLSGIEICRVGAINIRVVF
jgi:hypothetical protein